MDAYDREIQHLEEELDEGTITLNEFNQAIRDVNAEIEAAAEGAAQEAYDNEINRW